MQKNDKHKVILQAFPLHDHNYNTSLLQIGRYCHFNPYFGPQKDEFLRRVRYQFGEKVAFEYAFNIFYTQVA